MNYAIAVLFRELEHQQATIATRTTASLLPSSNAKAIDGPFGRMRELKAAMAELQGKEVPDDPPLPQLSELR
jgi:hypothetical protein